MARVEENDAQNGKTTSGFTHDDLISYCKRFSPVKVKPNPPWIYRVDLKFVRGNRAPYARSYARKDIYEPLVNSIGPFHYDNGVFKHHQAHKWRYGKAVLTRADSSLGGAKFQECIKSVSQVEEEARGFYSEPIELSNKDFVLMMVIDSLFIIELLYTRLRGEAFKDDRMFQDPFHVRDLLLLENQLPMFVINRVFKICTENEPGNRTLAELALRFFNPVMPRDEAILQKHFSNTTAKHFLDLLHRSLCDDLCQNANGSKKDFMDVPSAIELRNAGIKLIKRENTTSFLDIRFIKGSGVLEIPPLLVEYLTQSIFENLLAFELYCCGSANYVASYVFLMDCLIKSEKDLKFLERRGIIIGRSGDLYMQNLFSLLCQKVKFSDFYYFEQCKELNAYAQKHGRGWMAKLRKCVKS